LDSAALRPFEQQVRYRFRTEIPSPGDLMKFYSKNWIDYDTFREYMARHGYDDRWIELYERSVWVEPRFDQIFAAYARGVIPESDYRRWLATLNIMQEPRPGMTVPDAEIFEASMYRLPSPFLIAYALDAGVLDFETLRTLLRWELVHPQFIDVVAAALLERAYRDEKAIIRRYAFDQYIEGALTEEELRDELRALDVQEEFINRFVALLSKTRKKRLRSKALSYYEKAYLEGRLTLREFIGKLVDIGMDPELAQEWAFLIEDFRSNYWIYVLTKDERKALAKEYIDKFRMGALTEEELRSRLRRLQFADEEIELMIERAREELDTELRKRQYQDLIERLKTGLISKSEFVDACVRIWGSREKCLVEADYYWSKYIGDEFYKLTRDERSALASRLVRKYVMGFMEEQQLREELRRLGFTDQEIDLRVRLAQEEYEMKLLEDLIAEADAMLRRGEIAPDEYIEYLASLGMRKEKAEARARRILARTGR